MSGTIRVLLLEDDPADARLVGQMLRRVKTTPFEVTVAGRLAEAVGRLSASPDGFDVVLADLSVPDSSGIATLDRLTAAAPNLPIVVLTGNDDDAVALEAVKRGAQDYLVKGLGDAFILSRVVRYAIERKLGEAALREARDTAQQAAKAKSVFLAMMGHEIRTPLNGVLGMARLLQETPLDHRQRTFAETLVSSGELLLGLVNDILDFARLDAEGLTLERQPFDVIDAVEEVRVVLASRAGEKGLILTSSFDAAIPKIVDGDRLRLRQILFNLVGNAIKFTDRGRVSIHVEPLAQDGGIRFSVSDTGIGISDEAKPNLFTEFWQGDSGAARRFAGTGLGLAICRRLTSLMGGEIACDSTPGQGSTFRVDLPLLAGKDGGAPADGGGVAIEAPPCRVLLVDDNEVNREVAIGLLEQRGHAVVAVNDGFQAVETARQGGFDVILLDMRMPGMDGVETALAIKRLPGPQAAAPMYLLTANPVRDDELRWREAGILGCLAKPFRVDDFCALLVGLKDPGKTAAASSPAPEATLVAMADLRGDLKVLGRDRMVGLADLFRRSSQADLDAVIASADEARWADLAQTAHRMAGAAFSLHLGRLAAACRSLEDAARREGTEAVGMARDLEGLWTQSLRALNEALRTPD